MRYKIGRNPVYRAPIPALVGGINTASSSDIVGDNQLSNCLNMMAMDGILRTRPGFVIKDDDSGSGIVYLNSDEISDVIKIKKYDFTEEFEKIYGMGDEETGGIQHNRSYGKIVSVWRNNGDIYFYHIDKNTNTNPAGTIKTDGKIINELTVASNEGLYSYITFDDSEDKRHYKIYKSTQLKSESGDTGDTETFRNWQEVQEAYTPTVMTNCVSDANPLSGALSGDYLIGFNLLSNKYKIEITAVNSKLSSSSIKYAVYKLPHNPPVGSEITVCVLNNGKEETHSLTVSGNEWDIEPRTEEGETIPTTDFSIALKGGNQIVFYKFIDNNNKPEYTFVVDDIQSERDRITKEVTERNEMAEEPGRLSEDELKTAIETELSHYIALPGLNNITITAEHEPDEEAKKRIFSATCATWYGGNQGIASGTRLFIGGMEGIYKNVLQWSDLSNPLYFPENCNSEVGDPSQPITAFGKQADMLVVFKPFEIYGANYLLQDAPAVDTAYNYISDLTVTTAVFPLTQISSEIGCDCPGTIKLCRNRLCWIHSNGKAYTLVSSSQYNEKNIYELSEPIKRALPNLSKDILKNASSADWEGYYVLSAGEHIFLMQYESYGYSRIYSYTSEEAASHKLPWFYLRLPFKTEAVMCIDNELVTVSQINNYIIVHRADKNAVMDDFAFIESGLFKVNHIEIPSMVQSKIFDFSRPEIKKVICHILAEVGGTTGNSVKLSVITDRSRRNDFIENTEYISPISRYNEYSAEGKRIITPMAENIEKDIVYSDGENLVYETVTSLDSAAPDFFRIIRVNPGIFGVRKFAVRLESQGAFSLGQVCIEYKMLGSVN